MVPVPWQCSGSGSEEGAPGLVCAGRVGGVAGAAGAGGRTGQARAGTVRAQEGRSGVKPAQIRNLCPGNCAMHSPSVPASATARRRAGTVRRRPYRPASALRRHNVGFWVQCRCVSGPLACRLRPGGLARVDGGSVAAAGGTCPGVAGAAWLGQRPRRGQLVPGVRCAGFPAPVPISPVPPVSPAVAASVARCCGSPDRAGAHRWKRVVARASSLCHGCGYHPGPEPQQRATDAGHPRRYARLARFTRFDADPRPGRRRRAEPSPGSIRSRDSPATSRTQRHCSPSAYSGTALVVCRTNSVPHPDDATPGRSPAAGS
jgi:hypothetical protein